MSDRQKQSNDVSTDLLSEIRRIDHLAATDQIDFETRVRLLNTLVPGIGDLVAPETKDDKKKKKPTLKSRQPRVVRLLVDSPSRDE